MYQSNSQSIVDFFPSRQEVRTFPKSCVVLSCHSAKNKTQKFKRRGFCMPTSGREATWCTEPLQKLKNQGNTSAKHLHLKKRSDWRIDCLLQYPHKLPDIEVCRCCIACLKSAAGCCPHTDYGVMIRLRATSKSEQLDNQLVLYRFSCQRPTAKAILGCLAINLPRQGKHLLPFPLS